MTAMGWLALYVVVGLLVVAGADAVLVQAGKPGLRNSKTFAAAALIWPWFVFQGVRGIVRGLRNVR